MPHTIEDQNRRRRHRLAVNALWLLRLRWVAAAGQLITISVSHWFLDIRLPLAPLCAIIGLTVVTNAVLTLVWSHQIRDEAGPLVETRGEQWLAIVMAVDLVSLSALLALTGGLLNPFSVFYLVNLTLSAVILSPRMSWLLTGVAILGMLAIPFLDRPLPGWQTDADADLLHVSGALAAHVVCAIVVVYFITRVVNELHRREEELRRAEKERASAERLESLATLAAGAGHELASPLSTIAVIASDLNRHLDGLEVPENVREDVTLIREELDHCRAILHRMSSHAGHDLSEEIAEVHVDELMAQVLSGLRRSEAVRVEMSNETADLPIQAPLEGLAQAVRGVVQNGVDASGADGVVEVRVSTAGDGFVELMVEDQGEGMDPVTLSRASEPFFTTKETGKGMGLGLFLTRNVIERLGGTLDLQSEKNVGTTAIIRLPIARQALEA